MFFLQAAVKAPKAMSNNEPYLQKYHPFSARRTAGLGGSLRLHLICWMSTKVKCLRWLL